MNSIKRLRPAGLILAIGTVIFEAGPHQVIHEDFQAFCDALR